MPNPAQFDPDAFMAQQKPAAFDPDAFMAEKAQPAQAEQPNTFSHFLDTVAGYLPTPSGIANGLKEWWNRGDNIDSASQAREVLSKMHREAAADPANKGVPVNKWKVRPPTSEEQAAIDRGMNADLGSTEGQNPMLQPAVNAGSHIQKGDYAGAGGDLIGGYGIPAAVPALAEKAVEVAPTVKAVVKGAAQGAKEGALSTSEVPGHSYAARAAKALGVDKVPAVASSAVLGKYAAHLLFGPEAATAGEVVGAATPIVRGAWRGGKQALTDLRTPPSVEVTHTASWPPEEPPTTEVTHSASWPPEEPPDDGSNSGWTTHSASFEKPREEAPANVGRRVPAPSPAPQGDLPPQEVLDRLKMTPEDFKALPPDQQADIVAVAQSIQSPVGNRPAPPVDLAAPPSVEQAPEQASTPGKTIEQMLSEEIAAKKAARLEREVAARPQAQEPPAQPAAPPSGSVPADPALMHASGDAVIPGNGRETIYSNIGANLGEKIANAAAAKDIAAAEYLRKNHGITGDQFLNATPAQRDAWLKMERHPAKPTKSRYGGFSSTAAPGTPDYNARLQRFAQLLDAQPPPAGGPNIPALPGVEAPGAPPPADAMPPPAPPIQPLAEGHTASVYTPKGTKADVQYQLVSAPQVRTSFMPGGDPEFQPRSTDRAGSRQRIEQRKGDMNPEQMGESVNAGDGAPIMVPDGQLLTRNHGTQALNELYATPNSPKAAEYKTWLKANAQRFGIDPAVVASEPQPVLVRKILTPGSNADYAKFAEEANMSSVARMSDAEQAQMLAKRITGPVMEAFDPREDGTPNPEFVQALLSGLPPEEQAAFQDAKGRLSQTGVRNIRNAIFAKAYPDTSAIERMSESTDSNVRNISNGMLAAAPGFAKLQEAMTNGERFPLSIAEDAAKAAEIMDGLREQGMTPQQWLAQQNVFGRDPIVDKLVEIFAENRRSPKRIGEVLKEYTEGVNALGSPKQSGLFGAIEPPTETELLEAAHEAIKRRNPANAEAPLFQESQPPGAPGDGGSPSANAGTQPQPQAPAAASQPPPAAVAPPAPPEPPKTPRGKRIKPKLSSGNFEPGFPSSPEVPRNPYV